MTLQTSPRSNSHVSRRGKYPSLRYGTAFWMMLWLSASVAACESEEDTGGIDPSDMADGGPDAPAEGDSGTPGDGDDAPSTTVMTNAGPVAGEVVEHEGQDIHFFRGIPYAAAPVGELRWKPPQPLEPWSEARDATDWGDRCPQGDSTLSSPGDISEDCLNLNLLTPETQEGAGLPVMVFFHGGGLSIGTGNSPTYCHTALPAEDVVVVTVNHRLGPFGYFSHPALAAESEHDASGNYGTMDLIASLEWVQENIEAFGGNPDNVTIFGESGGGSKVLSCMASPRAEGLFHRAIIESGSRSATEGATTSREDAEQAGEAVAVELGIEDDADVLEALRARSWEEILDAATASEHTANLTIDGRVLPQSVYDAFAEGNQSDVPLIVGANEAEVSELMDSIPTLATSMDSVSSPAYVYNFTHLPQGWRTPGCYAFHGLELPYVFGHLEGLHSETINFLGMRSSCNTGEEPEISEEDEIVAGHTVRLWTQFAESGNPSVDGLVEWPPYTAEGDEYLEIASELEVKTGLASSGVEPGTGADE